MGTAVLHPQDYLTISRRDQKSHFLNVAEHPYSSAARSLVGRNFPSVYEPTSAVVEYGRSNAALCSKIPAQGGSMLSRENLAVGLRRSSNQLLPDAHNTYGRLAPRNSVSGFHEHVGTKRSLPACTGLHAPEVHIHRQLSMPAMLDQEVCVQRFFSERSPLRPVQPLEMSPLLRHARFPFNPAQDMQTCAGVTTTACHGALSSANLKGANSSFPYAHHAKRMHPHLSQAQACSHKQRAKTFPKALSDGQYRSTHTVMSTAGKKCNGYVKQLNRSVSERVWEKPADKTFKKFATYSTGGFLGACSAKSDSSEIELKLASSAPRPPSFRRKVEKGLQMQACADVQVQGRLYGTNVGIWREDLKGDFGAIEEDKAVTAGTPPQVEVDGGKGDARSMNESLGNGISRFETAPCSDGILAGHSSLVDYDAMWASMMSDEKWAGPSFYNSPPPSSLPVPSLSFLLSRALSSGPNPKSSRNTAIGAQTVSDKSLLHESSDTWDASFATKDLRRMLQLDIAAVEV